jgi:hypothetical protein
MSNASILIVTSSLCLLLSFNCWSDNNSNVLYSIKELPKSTPLAKITYVKGDKFVVRLKNLKGRVKINDNLFVLNSDKTGIIAEIKVVKFPKNYKVVVNVVRILTGYDKKYLKGLFVIHPEDLAKQNNLIKDQNAVNDKQLSRFNSPIKLKYLRSSSKMILVNVVTGADLNANTVSNGVSAEFFLPESIGFTWLNMFGLRSRYDKFEKSEITLKTANSNSTQAAHIAGSSYNLEFVFRPVFNSRLISRVGLYVGLIDKKSESIDIDAGESLPASKIKNEVSGNSLSIELESNPFAYFFIGAFYKLPIKQKSTIIEESSISSETTGKWERSEIRISPKIIYPLKKSLSIECGVDFLRRTDKVSSFNGGADTKNSYWNFEGFLGLGFNF